MALSVEARLLLNTAANNAGSDKQIRELLGQSIDWRKLIATSLSEGSQPVLWRRIREAAADHVPAAAAESLRQIERASDFRLMYLQRRLLDIVGLFSAAGIPVMLLKGAALLHTVYKSPADRPMADIDLLVHPDHVNEAHSLLISNGWGRRYPAQFDDWYRTRHHQAPLVDTRVRRLEVGLELHTQLFSQGNNPFDLPTPSIWSEARQVGGLPEGTLAPSEVHQLLHCCLHYAWSHQLSGAAWRTFRDIDAICRSGVDWDAFVEAAEECRGTAPCYWALQLARSLVGAQVPDGTVRRLRPALPGPILRTMQKHFEHEAVGTEQVCPSSRLRTMIWQAAVCARHSPRDPDVETPASLPWHLLRSHANGAENGREETERPAFSARAWIGYLQAVF